MTAFGLDIGHSLLALSVEVHLTDRYALLCSECSIRLTALLFEVHFTVGPTVEVAEPIVFNFLHPLSVLEILPFQSYLDVGVCSIDRDALHTLS